MDIRDLKAAGDQSGIYKIVNIITERFYIGSAINLKRRWQDHRKELIANKHRNSRLQNSWNMHGEKAFIFAVLEYVSVKADLIKHEQRWLDLTQCYNEDIGYNINKIAESSLGVKRSQETKNKLALAHLGRKHSTEHIAKRVVKLKGHHVSEAARQALRKRSLGNTFGLGYKHTDEIKIRIGQAHKGKPKSEEHKKKIAETLRNKVPFIITSTPVMLK